jgi:hypothetical protein
VQNRNAAALRLLLAKRYGESFEMLRGEFVDSMRADSWDQVVVDGDVISAVGVRSHRWSGDVSSR